MSESLDKDRPDNHEGFIVRHRKGLLVAVMGSAALAGALWLSKQTGYEAQVNNTLNQAQVDIPERLLSRAGLKERAARALHGDFSNFPSTQSAIDFLSAEENRRPDKFDAEEALGLPKNMQYQGAPEEALSPGLHVFQLPDPKITESYGVVLLYSEAPDQIDLDNPDIKAAVFAKNKIESEGGNKFTIPEYGNYPMPADYLSTVADVPGGVTNEAFQQMADQLASYVADTQ